MRNHLLLVVVVLGDDLHPVGHEVHRVKAHTKLTDQVDIPTLLHLLQEACGLQGTKDKCMAAPARMQ